MKSVMTRDSEKKETGKFDAYTVKNWLGHEEIQTTENYIRYAEQYYNQLPVDWIGCALKPQNYLGGKHSGCGTELIC